MAPRFIAKVFKSRPTIEGAGVHLKRAFGYSQVPQFDPFLMLDDFHTANPAEYMAGFPWHPHRGIETITYVLEGLVEHGDSMGNKGVMIFPFGPFAAFPFTGIGIFPVVTILYRLLASIFDRFRPFDLPFFLAALFLGFFPALFISSVIITAYQYGLGTVMRYGWSFIV